MYTPKSWQQQLKIDMVANGVTTKELAKACKRSRTYVSALINEKRFSKNAMKFLGEALDDILRARDEN